MAGKFGILSVADVVFYEVETGAPTILFDTLKVSTIENEAETAEARGGQGNPILINWNYNRTGTLTMQDALLSMESLALLSGNDVEEGATIYAKEEHTVSEAGDISLDNAPVGDVTVHAISGGVLGENLPTTTPVEGTSQDVGGLEVAAGTRVVAFYEHEAPAGSQTVRFSSDAFPGQYRVVGSTVVRDQQSGKDKAAQFLIKRAQLQAGFSITMDAENVSVFDFNLNILKDTETTDLYEITVIE